ncbi:beta-1,4 N-acetylgalactosaminyltransferase 2 [Mixophyes fleayi]|uniref:beta-1,4 N-acetylgalactosaminyltransferase 2 n=1 Tax=Mixophyes fleayi TaxID=3061075 RepID=UPI003F4D75D0
MTRYKALLVCTFIGSITFFYMKRYIFNVPDHQPNELPPEIQLKLIPEDKLLSRFLYEEINFYSGGSCSCENKKGVQVHELKNYVDDVASVHIRRMKELQHFQKRTGTVSNKKELIIAPSNSPLSYPIQGIQVMPLHTIQIQGLSVKATDKQNYEVTLKASHGNLNTFADVSEEVQGRGTNTLTIATPYLKVLNHILHYITYTSTEFNINIVDMVTYQMGEHVAKFPLNIIQPPIPHLFDSGPDQNLSSLVTIATKTFFRYDKLRILIKSIRKFYPDIKIIIADDNENPQKILEANVEQYFMPFAKGWFAGRNLAVSQVPTKYFLWVDDDFEFTESTKIEKFVQILEETDLDVIGGSLAGDDFKFKLLYQEGDGDGGCLHRRSGFYHKLEGYPNCVISSVVANLFLAHTQKVLSVGFDPKLDRIAHSEFFFDGFGRLKVGSCNDFIVGHQQKSTPKTENEKIYKQFRFHNEVKFKLGLLYFKNNLKCYTQN